MRLVWNALAAMIAVLVLGATCTSSWADTYTWTDQDGNLHFSDTPPATGHVKTIRPDPHCALKDEVEAWKGEAQAYMFLYLFGGKDVLKNSKMNVDMNTYQVVAAKVKTEEKKCEEGDAGACECLRSMSEKGSKSFAPTGNLIEEDKPQPRPEAKAPKARPHQGGR